MQRFRSYWRWETPVAGSDSLGLTSTATWINDLSFHCSSSPPNTGWSTGVTIFILQASWWMRLKLVQKGHYERKSWRSSSPCFVYTVYINHREWEVDDGEGDVRPHLWSIHSNMRLGGHVEHNSRRGTRGSSGHVLPAIMTRRVTQYLRGMYFISSHVIMKIFA